MRATYLLRVSAARPATLPGRAESALSRRRNRSGRNIHTGPPSADHNAPPNSGAAAADNRDLPPSIFQHMSRLRRHLSWIRQHEQAPGRGGGSSGQHSIEGGSSSSAAISVRAFVRSLRTHRHLTFLSLSDGSLPATQTLQAVVPAALMPKLRGGDDATELSPGSVVDVRGELMPSRGRGQDLELKVSTLDLVGECDALTYPIPLTQHSTKSSAASPELLRRWAHLRSREPRHAAVLRSRDAMERGMAEWFEAYEFTRVTPPIITSSDCEGAGEVFAVVAEADLAASTDTAAGARSSASPGAAFQVSEEELESRLVTEPSLDGDRADRSRQDGAAKSQAEKAEREEPSLSGCDSDGPRPKRSFDTGGEVLSSASAARNAPPPHDGPRMSAPTVRRPNETTWSFWSGSQAYLTVSSQLHLEAFLHGLHRVWTCNPAFRAEGSATNRHLAEFWMCEAEQVVSPSAGSGGSGKGDDVALDEVMASCQGAVTAAVRGALGWRRGHVHGNIETRRAMSERRVADLTYLLRGSAEGDGAAADEAAEARLEELRRLAEDATPWPVLRYTDAVAELRRHHEATRSAKKTTTTPAAAADAARFSVEPRWGESLASEHERWLATRFGGGRPVFVTDFPRRLKPFYMRANAPSDGDNDKDGGTVACFDLLVPRVGELAGGSLREEREWVLRRRMQRLGLLPRAGAGDRSDVDGDGERHFGGKNGKEAGGGGGGGGDSAADADHDDAEALRWYYSELRRYGSAPHGGWGLGMERLASWITGVENVRDCVTFARVKGRLRY